jgi:glycerol-3-phosphate dehydrogenase
LSSSHDLVRQQAFQSLSAEFDVLVIGGGATGLGIALDSAVRGFRTALVEAGDFAQATSSRSTKLIHGGVRYLASGQIHLVWEALHERAVMQHIAPHLVHPLPTVLPATHVWQLPYYGAGLTAYDVLSGKSSLGPTRILSRRATQERVPGIAGEKLSGGILYHDGQFNDARFALALARTAIDQGATVLNYVRCAEFLYSDAARTKIRGAEVRDVETGETAEITATAVINATGIFSDETRTLDQPDRPPLLTVSRGSHIVVPSRFLGGSTAIMVPKTEDGRVIFAIPWQGVVLVGTTDIPAERSQMEPGFEVDEIDYLLRHIAPYLSERIGRDDILSVFSGLRPLVTGKENSTSKLSREHHIDSSRSGLITVAGGKWTTYRRMAEDTLDFAARRGLVPVRFCDTRVTLLRGAPKRFKKTETQCDPILAEYGTDASLVLQEAAGEGSFSAEPIDPALPYTNAMVTYAVRHEFARTLDDVLSRRTRSLLLDVRAALRAARGVAAIMARELNRDAAWIEQQVGAFEEIARSHTPPEAETGSTTQ